jgi:hypothetical protein
MCLFRLIIEITNLIFLRNAFNLLLFSSFDHRSLFQKSQKNPIFIYSFDSVGFGVWGYWGVLSIHKTHQYPQTTKPSNSNGFGLAFVFSLSH